MENSAGLVAVFDAVAHASKVDPDMLLERLATRLAGVVRPPRTDRARQPASWRLDDLSGGQIRTRAPWGRRPLATHTFEETVSALESDARLVRMLIDYGGLQAVDIDGRLHIPDWQFNKASPTGLLRGLGMILTAAEGRLGWKELALFMVTPQPSLVAEGALSIVEWLHDDRSLGPILDIVRASRER